MARVALVTGGTRGIGAAISKALKAAGYKVAACYAGNDVAAAKFKDETGIPVYKWDVASFDACAAGVKQVEADLGPVEVLVANAGVTDDTLLLRMSEEQFTRVVDTNLTGSFRCAKRAASKMLRAKWGRMIFISSVVGLYGSPGQVNYAASKAGLIGIARSITRELGSRNITANVVAPGFIETDMTHALSEARQAEIIKAVPAGRFASVDEVAAVVTFLASDGAAYVNGAVLPVDGGLGMGH